MRRQPAVAGTFYPAQPAVLSRELRQLIREPEEGSDRRALALMVPHAGYIYSGKVAGATYSSAALSRRVVILGPNHTGAGEPIAVFDEGTWDLPLGEVPIDEPLARSLLARCPAARSDARAHMREHSLEVQIPFLQHLLEEISLVPVCVGTLRLPLLLELGQALADVIREADGEVLIVMSSDMSHYIPAAEAENLDRMALERVLAIDPEGLHKVVLERRISMCGIAPTVAGLEAVRRLGARQARLIAYANSGDRTGDYASVVAYAGVAVT